MKEQPKPKATLELHNVHSTHVVIDINEDDDIDTYIENFAKILAAVGFSDKLIADSLDIDF